MSNITRRAATMLGLATAILPRGANAQGSYPSRPIHLIVGFSPGSAMDVATRILANALGERLGQKLVIENKPGAGSNIAAEYAAHVANDGYTLFVGSSANMSNQAINPKLPFDMLRDFEPIAPFTSVTVVLVVNPASDIHSVAELVALAKSRPGGVLFGSVGIGSAPQLAAELFSQRIGVKLIDVPYQGSPLAVADLIAGRTTMMFSPASTVVGQIAAGKLTALAVASSKRAAILPDIPTMAEAGMPDFDTGIWFCLLAPKGARQAVIDKIADATQKSMSQPDVVATLNKQGIDALTGSPDSLRRLMTSELSRWSGVARAAGLKQ